MTTGIDTAHDRPDRLYTITSGRSRGEAAGMDLVTLVVSEREPEPGMQSEYTRILSLCADPTAVVEVAAELGLPVSVVKILVADLVATGAVTVRHPSAPRAADQLPDPAFLEKVLVGLRNL
ncbi:DUF742 domain-containing protein [Saccharomonospora xinjiangensis]|uniref:DUF742 domain-containing protein n=1 Tax=Saccharomonospora xinjiangensis XJ-54 TaxID=882086 RepID=I0V081_9PSEU|nr:DUF742 domain-containing protein [Saccharomonospora xinjiangensis]EID53534.1 Protein of unknown function (DUF742) [Saccharomonospora xinjiangensis XJ-54]